MWTEYENGFSQYSELGSLNTKVSGKFYPGSALRFEEQIQMEQPKGSLKVKDILKLQYTACEEWMLLLS